MLINLKVKEKLSGKTLTKEGFLSIPNIHEAAWRFKKILYNSYDAHGNRIERETEGFHARIVQREAGHLDGKLFIYEEIDTIFFRS